jgi:hypothetical protein
VLQLDYVEIIKEAWKTAWTKKYLWWFGLLAAFSSGGGGMNFRMPAENGSKSTGEVSQFISQNLHWMIPAAVILAVLMILFMILGIIGRGALIKAADLALKDKQISFKEGFREGKRFFWKILLTGVLSGLALLFSIIILAVPIAFLFISKAYALGIFLSVFALLILITLIILISFIKTFGYLYIVLGKLSLWPALENAYQLFCDNLWPSIIMSLFFIPLGIAFFLSILAAAIPLALIFLAAGFGLNLAVGKAGIIIAIALGALIFIILMLFLRSIFETFSQTVWIIFFKKIASPKVKDLVAEEETEEEIKVLPATDIVKTIENEK